MTGSPTTGRRRLGIYWNARVYNDARTAYVVDLDALTDPPIGFARWVEAALVAHTRLTVAQRADIAEKLPHVEPSAGIRRPIWLADETIHAVKDSVVDDRRKGGRARSVSEYTAEAVRNATAAASARNGGVLPPPPIRLPPQPAR